MFVETFYKDSYWLVFRRAFCSSVSLARKGPYRTDCLKKCCCSFSRHLDSQEAQPLQASRVDLGSFFRKAPEAALKILTFFKGVGKDTWHFSLRAMLGHLKGVWAHWFLKSLFPILLLVPPLQAMFLWNSGTCRDLWYNMKVAKEFVLYCFPQRLQIHYFAAFISIK